MPPNESLTATKSGGLLIGSHQRRYEIYLLNALGREALIRRINRLA